LKGITNYNKMPYVGKNSHLKILIRHGRENIVDTFSNNTVLLLSLYN